MNWSLGIDPSLKGFHGCVVVDENKRVYDRMKTSSTAEMIEYIHHFQMISEEYGHRLLVGVEQINSHLNEVLLASDVEFYSIMPLKLAHYKKTYDVSGMKTDLIDAESAAYYTMDWYKQLTLYRSRDTLQQRAWEVTKQFEVLRKTKTAAWERFWSAVNYGSPELKDLDFANDTDWFLRVVIDLLPSCKTVGCNGFIAGCRKRGSKTKEEVLKDMLSCFKTLRAQGKASLLGCIAHQIKCLNQEIKHRKEEIRPILAEWEYGWVLKTIKGMGIKTMTALLAYLGRNWDHTSSAQASAYAGIAPILIGSSTPPKSGAKTKKSRGKPNSNRRVHRLACNKDLKTVICLFSLYSLPRQPWAKAKYDQYRERSQSHWEALRNLSIKWMRILFKITKAQVPFDPVYLENDSAKSTH